MPRRRVEFRSIAAACAVLGSVCAAAAWGQPGSPTSVESAELVGPENVYPAEWLAKNKFVTPTPLRPGAADPGLYAPAGRDGSRVSCDPQATPEGEFDCGLDGNGQPFDLTNGGCVGVAPFFTPIQCGEIICGTSGYSGVGSDTDWYEVTIGVQATLTWTVTADFKAVIGLAGGTGGVADCDLYTGVTPFQIIEPNVTGVVSVCLGPGTWWFVVAPDFDQDPFACGLQYQASLDCVAPCVLGGCCLESFCQEVGGIAACQALGGLYQGDGTQCVSLPCVPPANDDCVNAETFIPGDTLIADLRNGTLANPEETPPCAGSGQSVAVVWYRFVGQGGVVRISSCLADQSDLDATDSVIAVYASNQCPPLIDDLIACADDSDCGSTLRLTELCFTTVPGQDYLVQVSAWSEESRGLYEIITEPSSMCAPPEPIGACCFPDPEFPFCVEVQQSQCVAVNGDFDETKLCTEVDCSGAIQPANGSCDAPVIVGIPSSTPGDLTYAPRVPSNVEDCGLPNVGPSLWYSVFGDGREITASLCGSSNFDARIHVFCEGGCLTGNWDCVAANDNALSGACGLAPEVTWCSAIGQEYQILITGRDGVEGQFTLNVSSSGGTCQFPVDCSGNCFLDCPPGGISELEPACGPDYEDDFNGGCGSDPIVFGQLTNGDVICGLSGTFPSGTTQSRDVDWYEFTIDQEADVVWRLQATFLVETFLLQPGCGPLAAFEIGRGNPCQQVELAATLQPGTYSILIEPQFFAGAPCDPLRSWIGELTWTPTANNGPCCLSFTTCIETTQAQCEALAGGFGTPGTTCAQVTCDPCPADINQDGEVDVFDFADLAENFGQQTGATRSDGDIDLDGDVDVFDFGDLAEAFGDTCP